MLNRCRQILHSSLFANASRLLTANVIAQAIGLLIYPLLTRLYDTADFGLFNLFLSIGGIFVLLATGQYEYAIVLPRSNRQAAWSLHCGLLTTAGVTTLCLLFLPFAKPIAALFDSTTLSGCLWMMPLYVLSMSLWALLNYWLSRHERFDRVSSYQVDQSLLNAGIKLGCGWLHAPSGLIYGSVFAPMTALIITLWRMPRQLWNNLCSINLRGIRSAAYRYRNFPKYTLPKSLIDSLSSNLPLLVMAPAFGLTTVGYVGMALTLSFRPVNIICSSINQVFYQRAASLIQQRQSPLNMCWNYVKTTLAVTLPIFALLYLCLPSLCDWLLGDGWSTTGQYIRLMLPWLLMVLVSNAINFIPDLFGQQRGLLLLFLGRLVLQIMALWIGTSQDSAMLSVALYFGVSALMLLIQLIWFHRLLIRHNDTLNT
ncbi:MAG: lipopolysaccharide biosynthesis protein [Bacteroidales bacterium]|nr:lipopolysaccharide biosynthesis protein [Bacteroidales bacterium]